MEHLLSNEFEASKLKSGSRTPHFYGLSKLHKQYNNFPPFVAALTPALRKSLNSLMHS